jgi:putative DNA primase/helicase
MAYLWSQSRPLDGQDLASRYLGSRGIKILPAASAARFNDGLPYWQEDKTKLILPTMLAKFAAPDGQSAILHRTYLAEPGTKADIEKPRQLVPGKVPNGGAVRLMPAAETMGIAEGIETALSAAQIFNIPVWAALTVGSLIKWQPPSKAKSIIIFADNDKSFAGQSDAFSLAHKLKIEGLHVEVRVPDDAGADWNDELALQAPMCSSAASVA